MRYFIITFGCQMNKSDSEKISALLKKSGCSAINDPKQADLIIINACSVRQSAINRVYGKIQKYLCKKIIVAGCLTDFDKKRLASYKNVIIWHPDKYFDLSPLRLNKLSAFVPIMTGCNNFCSYCVVPHTRGREKSRPVKKIAEEIKVLVKNGYKEIILLGQNVNSYRSADGKLTTTTKSNSGSSRSMVVNFTKLIKIINKLPEDFRLNFLTSHPKDMSGGLIETLARCKKIIPYIHLPVQSGDNKILRKMNRCYTISHYKRLIKKIRAAFKKYRSGFPPVAVSTDIIVGFPGETKKQFQNTIKLCRQIKFDMIYFAQYSPRPGTAAAKLPDDVPKNEKRRRAMILNGVLKKTALGNNKKYIGKTIKILINKVRENSVFGKTDTSKTVRLPAKNYKIGDMIKVKITKVTAWGMEGK